MNRLEEYAEELHQEVLIQCSSETSFQTREEVFTQHLLEILSEHNETDGAELCYHNAQSVGRIPAARLNAWSLSGDAATLDLFVSLYHGTGEVVEVRKPDARRQFQLLRGFLRRALDGFYKKMEESSDAFHAMHQIFESRNSLTTVRMFLLTDGVVRSLDLEEEPFPELDIRYVVWDLEKLSRLRVGQREVIELDFENDYGGEVPCIEMRDPTGEYRTFLAFFPGPMVAQIYGEYGQRLLERNVRAFLQTRGKVNRGLQKTLKEEPHRFLAYNNGLCCTAAEVKTYGGENGHARLRWVKDFQIVNGGQTTASIYHAVRKERLSVDHVVVQVKLTVLRDQSKIPEIVPLISRYANSQNKVNGADFAANGPFHRQLEELSRTVWAPATSGLERGTHWYYERARGSYADDKGRQGTPARRREWEKQNPPRQKFTKTDLAKFEHAWLGLPHLVCLGAEKNFNKMAERMEEEGEPLVNLDYFKRVVARAILWRTTEKLFDTLDITGYRANSVAYAVALLAERSRRRIDLDRIWKEQRCSQALCDALKCAAGAAHEHITRQEGNPGEASKTLECWQAFKSRKIELPLKWEAELAQDEFIDPRSETDALSTRWERLRRPFINDMRTIEGLEAYTQRTWIAKRRRDTVSKYASMTWDELKQQRGLGTKRVRDLIEMFEIASKS